MFSDLCAYFAYFILFWFVYWAGKMILKAARKFF